MYTYFDSNNITGYILTTDPVFAAYSDKRYISIYNTINKDDTYVNPYDKDIVPDAAVYNSDAFGCANTDTDCIRKSAQLADYIDQNYHIIYIYDNYKLLLKNNQLNNQ